MKLSKEQLWKAMRQPNERGCFNCLNNFGGPCAEFRPNQTCHGNIERERGAYINDKGEYWNGKYLAKWEWHEQTK